MRKPFNLGDLVEITKNLSAIKDKTVLSCLTVEATFPGQNPDILKGDVGIILEKISKIDDTYIVWVNDKSYLLWYDLLKYRAHST